MFSILGKNFSRIRFEFFFLPEKKGLTFSMETVCMKCQSLFSGKAKKNIVSLLSAEFA